MQAFTCVEDVVKAILQKSLGLLRSTTDYCVTVLPQCESNLTVRVSFTYLLTTTYYLLIIHTHKHNLFKLKL